VHKSSIQNGSNASWLISYSDMLLGFNGLSAFSNRPTVLGTSK